MYDFTSGGCPRAIICQMFFFFFFSSRRRHTRLQGDWSSDVLFRSAVHEFGMEPDVIAARVLEAMREDRFHIFTHPEFKDELGEVFAEILQDFRDYPIDPGHGQRTDFEKTRRESYRKQRQGLKAN